MELGNDKKPFLALIAQLIRKGVEVRLIHAKEPGQAFREDFDKYPVLYDRLERVLCPRVHFKIIVLDCQMVYIGSANLTGAGIGMKADTTRNFEAGIITDNPELVEAAINQFDEVWIGNMCKKSKKGNTALIQSAVDTDSIENSNIFGVVEEMPSFPGGMAALMKYIKDNLRYPEICWEGAAMGRVNVVFIVNEDGSLSDVKVIRSIIPELDKEAIRVVKSMPKWNPAKQNGKAVKMKYVVSVNFRPE